MVAERVVGASSTSYRGALSAFATGVTIVTTRNAQGEDVGLTANSFNSVSLDPPLVLWSLAKTSHSLAAFAQANHFAVHILAADQIALSNQFAKRGADKFAGLELERGESEVPLLTGCTARFRCRTAYQYEGGDHIIFVGEVLGFDHSGSPPLVFHAGSYAVTLPHRPADAEGKPDLAHLVQSAYFHLLTPVRAERERLGISLHEHYALGVLLMHAGPTIEEIDSVVSYTGLRITEETARGLVDKGLAQFDLQVATRLRLTAAGRNAVVRLVGAAKAIEADALLHFTDDERRLLADLLGRLTRVSKNTSSRVSEHMDLLNQILQSGETPSG